MKKNIFKFGLIGFPLTHSISPRIHAAALRDLRVGGDYRLYPIPPLPEGVDRLHEMIQKMRDGSIDGLNVTIPHKQTILPLLDALTDTAQNTGAVNTIMFREDLLVGDNTDVAGFLTDLGRYLPPDINTKRALVLGAGGSARAVVFGLLRERWQVKVAARRFDQAQQLAAYLNGNLSSISGKVDPVDLEILRSEDYEQWLTAREEDFTLIVNTTPVGMTPDIGFSPWPENAPWPKFGLVYDLVYNPLETAFMRSASMAGLKAVGGLGMLVEQAALAFERWTGLSAPREAMARAAFQEKSFPISQSQDYQS